ncbi:hypothetical protein [Rufibacter hautae]|uniref:DUF4252 domain-containing protein n=1 Tax=Rufibacter hautae TaxID=2595005 RepID=A0A5B6TGZ0_9BACT|nr:hypothetical protein [Rufibacter hautae]KAA3439661.1 hypothetical protein FOA19_03000 [Rufibacter hautae]
MKSIKLISALLVFLVLISKDAFGQSSSSFYLSQEENQQWLATLTLKDKDAKLGMIADRLLLNDRESDSLQRQCCYPLLIVEGIPLENTNLLSDSIGVVLSNYLNKENVKDVAVFDKAAEMILCTPSNGIILLTLRDKRTAKQFRRLMGLK